MESVFM